MIACVLLLAGCLPGPQDRTMPTTAAQVVPAAAEGKEGNALEGRLGLDQVRFSQQIGPALLPRPATITAISLRRDGLALPTETLRYAFWHKQDPHQWDIRVGPIDRGSRLTGSFPLESGLTRVHHQQLRLPDLPPVTSVPTPFLVRFPFQQPYVYDGKGICIDFLVGGTPWNDSTVDPYVCDAVRIGAGGTTVVPFGKPTAQGPRAYATGGATLSLLMFDSKPQIAALALLGTELLTGPLYVVPLVVVGVPTNSNGSARVDFPWLPGVRFAAQWLSWDGQTIELSGGLAIETGDPPLDAWVVYGTGFMSRATQGFVDPDLCVVLELS